MKIVTASNGDKTLKISRDEWENIGKTAGWYDAIKDKAKGVIDLYNSPSGSKSNPVRKPKDELYFKFSVNYENVRRIITRIQKDINDGKITSTNQLTSAISELKSSGALEAMAKDVKLMLQTYPSRSEKRDFVIEKIREVKDSISNLKSQLGIVGD